MIDRVHFLLSYLENSNQYDDVIDVVKLQLCKLLTDMDASSPLRPVVEEIYVKVFS